MDKEQFKSNKPSFALVGLMAAAAIILILLFASIIVGWRAKKNNKTPYSRTPTSQVYVVPGTLRAA